MRGPYLCAQNRIFTDVCVQVHLSCVYVCLSVCGSAFQSRGKSSRGKHSCTRISIDALAQMRYITKEREVRRCEGTADTPHLTPCFDDIRGHGDTNHCREGAALECQRFRLLLCPRPSGRTPRDSREKQNITHSVSPAILIRRICGHPNNISKKKNGTSGVYCRFSAAHEGRCIQENSGSLLY